MSARVSAFVTAMHRLAWAEVGKPATHPAFHYWLACQKSAPDQPATMEQVELDLWLTWLVPEPLDHYRARALAARERERLAGSLGASVPFSAVGYVSDSLPFGNHPAPRGPVTPR